ncbi:MAG: VRR-NUC domain-containing protein [Marinomonas gallaica]
MKQHKITDLSQSVRIYRHTGVVRSEDNEQMAFMDWIKYNLPELEWCLFHVPNSTYTTKRQAEKAVRMGVKSGVSDLILLLPKNGYPYAVIEVKKKGGSLSANQKKFLNKHVELGAFVCVAFGLEALKKMINEYCNIDPV